ncbi:MAG: DUF1405 domain-containing protein [Chloroflexaceae bacterium]|nr:DUF1405 domain-containing protein [Chloroflexaceae bacterium]NJO05192.1 DUF1405 domain-containing protein [Chloroflexaceae bacterium]
MVDTLLQTFRATLEGVLRNALLFWAILIANLLGVVGGFIFWYGPMLMVVPLWTYPFVPDCPLAALLFSIAFVGLKYRQRWHWFYALTAFACIKYGLWTVAYWTQDWTHGGAVDPVSVAMFVTHVGLFIEGLLLLPLVVPVGVVGRGAVLGWYALSVFVDYALRYHPPLGPFVEPSFALGLAATLTTVLGLGLLLLPYQHQTVGEGQWAVG